MPFELLVCHLVSNIYFSFGSLAGPVAFRFLSFAKLLVIDAVTSVKTLFGEAWVTLLQTSGPPRFWHKPAPIHRWPLCGRFMTFPPSNLLRICIQHSARLVVALPCLDVMEHFWVNILWPLVWFHTWSSSVSLHIVPWSTAYNYNTYANVIFLIMTHPSLLQSRRY